MSRRLGIWLACAIWASGTWATGGDLVWRRDLGRLEFCPEPVVSDGRLFVYSYETARDFSLRPAVRAMDVESGERLWAASGRGGWDPVTVVGPGIAVAGGRIFVAAERPVSRSEIPALTEVTAYDAASGDELWRLLFDSGSYFYEVTAIEATAASVFGEATLFVVGRRSRAFDPAIGPRSEAMVLAIDAGTGKERWASHFSVEGRYDRAHAIALASGGRIAVSADVRTGEGRLATMVRVYEARSGRVLWSDLSSIGSPWRLAHNRDQIYSLGWTTNRRHSFLVAYDLATGASVWRRRIRGTLGQWLDASHRRVAVLGSNSSFSPVDSRIRVFDGRTGEILWRRNETGEVLRQVLTHGSKLYAIGSDADYRELRIEAYRMRSGRSEWSLGELDSDADEFASGCRLARASSLLVATGESDAGAVVRAFEP